MFLKDFASLCFGRKQPQHYKGVDTKELNNNPSNAEATFIQGTRT